MDVGLGGVEPPRVDAEPVQALVDLAPEDAARRLGVRIVERRLVALTDPVLCSDLDVAAIDEAVLVELLEVVGGGIELGPDPLEDPAAVLVVVSFLDAGKDHAVRLPAHGQFAS